MSPTTLVYAVIMSDSFLYRKRATTYNDWSIYAWLEPSTVVQGLYDFYRVKQCEEASDYFTCMVYLDAATLEMTVWMGFGDYMGLFVGDAYYYDFIPRKERYILKNMVNSKFKKNYKAKYMDTEFLQYQEMCKAQAEMAVELGFTHTFDHLVKEKLKCCFVQKPWLYAKIPPSCNIDEIKAMLAAMTVFDTM